MAQDNYQTALMQLLAAELWMMLSMTAAREMFGRSYFCLGAGEKAALDYMVAGTIGGNFAGLTPQFLRVPHAQIAGFVPQPLSQSSVGFVPQPSAAPSPSGTRQK